MDQMESQLLSWHVPVDRLGVVHITFCPSTFRIWCDDILVENVQVEISHATPNQKTKESKSSLHQGFLCLTFPVQPINKPLTLKAAFTSKMDMRNVVNTGSPNFLTKLSHLTLSLGVKVTGWRINNH
ncbi:hypothetical protein FGIG_09354 [Fasciola gigantica]|uniref:Uncharacterized protein n=1 Tax=Fasciola gigantica TaxID=46835 RepID=A0A504YIF8_FASGI|nr:hypothetical protein FGIG_09354 [Fasciola gigantica]